ncbi:glycoside hydrolase family 127 protein [Serinibacter arcticus]|uniref:Glycoside hydrolase family 127 protein n=1 Tax=Serinibacter arcticus TaxID=1655435 RepID=A0A2U1ZY00_9MICO|nr:beta-L-arabinofuranosidase domain-containing protein [Serinibacter arcticus]PWD51813.1 glycoside hydrolase family 127 protein [Serinibacter arcticus]
MPTAAARSGPVSSVAPAAPVAAVADHRGLDLAAVRLTHGPLAEWQELNAAATIPHCIAQLETSGVLDNFRRVVGESGAEFRGFWFADSDLYKVIEAVGWEIARTGTEEFDAWLDDVVGLVARTAEPSGYVHTYIQGVAPEKKFVQLELTHEMYVLGHMIQAAVALSRANGRDDLLRLARSFADLVDRRFGPGREDGICGHPEIETALVELYRHTGEERYLRLAERMVDLRGRGLLPVGGLGARYFQDHAPVREATSAVGHAVRQLYLNAGVTDVYLETGDATLMSAMDAQWASVHERKMYISGAFGSRHRDEAFGDDYELPSERAYAETCATIADLHWTWRMLLAGGAAGAATFAETIEREIHNALAASIDASGTRFFYSNPLQQRPDRYSEENAPRTRTPWYVCACCPPNIARTVAQLSCYVASSTADTLWVHLLAGAEIDLPEHLGDGVLRIETSYPADGAVRLSVHGQVVDGARLAVRIPSWSSASEVRDDDGAAAAATDGYAVLPLTAGATYDLDLDLAPRFTRAHHRVDAVRGTLAIERGPLVYCIEQADLDGVEVDDLVLVPGAGVAEGEGTALTVTCAVVPGGDALYPAAGAPPTAAADHPATVTATAIPFATWGNRAPGPMRVWIPVQTF